MKPVNDFEFKRITPEAAGVPSMKIVEFLDALEDAGTEMHALALIRGDGLFAESFWKPYCPEVPHIMYSFTKSLTSTAIGFAVNEGKLSLDDKLADIFPDKIPEKPSENLMKCTVKDLLTMSCGHHTEIKNFGIGYADWIQAFIEQPFEHEPGKYFMYNTAGTNMLSAILTVKTGEKLMDYLKPRLFDRLGMGEVYCASLPDGTHLGGAGGFLKLSQMERFIRFIANRGMWLGERLLPESWFDMACGYMIDNTPTQTNPDWTKGYGFQFWQCVPEGAFRADGAFGQYGIVVPDKDLLIIMQSASSTMQDTLTVCWEKLLPYVSDEALPEDEAAFAVLTRRLESDEVRHPISKKNPSAKDLYDRLILMPDRAIGGFASLIGGAGTTLMPKVHEKPIKELEIKINDDSIELVSGDDVLPISMNSRFNSFELYGRRYGAVGTWLDTDVLEFTVYCASAASGKIFRMDFKDKVYLNADSSLVGSGGMNESKFSAITFTVKEENAERKDTYKPYFLSE